MKNNDNINKINNNNDDDDEIGNVLEVKWSRSTI